jgi:hypothetical protein
LAADYTGIQIVRLAFEAPTPTHYAALSRFGMAQCDSLLPALGFRVLAGIAMAGMYMPGLRALTHGVKPATRARIASWYTTF